MCHVPKVITIRMKENYTEKTIQRKNYTKKTIKKHYRSKDP